MMNQSARTFFVATLLSVACVFYAMSAYAAVTYTSASNPQASLYSTVPNDDGSNVFIIKGLADGESSDFMFATDSDCPMIAMTGGAQFTSQWTCSGGVITASVTYKGGLSFGPATDENAGSFYLSFGNPPTPAGSDAPPAAFSGIQISLYGDISQWSLSGEMTASGAAFGVELSGPQGGGAHFLMELPEAAVTFLGGVLGVSVGGKPYPFATVTTNGNGSATIAVDITKLEGSAARQYRAGTLAKSVTKKILASERKIGIAADKSSVKAGASVTFAMCAGSTFSAGDKVAVKYTVGGKSSSSLKASTVKLDAKGCATKKVKIAKSLLGKLVAQITDKNKKKASTSVKITR